jgi:hypothetical protein
MPDNTQQPRPPETCDIDRGRTLVRTYIEQTDEFSDNVDEHAAAAGALIADVLAYVVTLTDADLPAPYRGGPISRIAVTAARGVWNALSAQTRREAPDQFESDPDPDDLHDAVLVFGDYMARA